MKDMNSFFLKETTTGKILRSFRKNFNITQKEISKITGISESNMSAIENDRREIGIDVATRIGAFLGIHPSLLLFPNGQDVAIGQYKKIQREAKRLIARKVKKAI